MGRADLRVPRIQAYRFGRIEIDGDGYRHDVIIFPDRVMSDWWREEGHSLTLGDLQAVLEEEPEILIVGLGRYGRMTIPDSTRSALQDMGIEVLALPTQEACQAYNRLAGSRRVIAALHLTC